jgi:hypothetical protein
MYPQNGMMVIWFYLSRQELHTVTCNFSAFNLEAVFDLGAILWYGGSHIRTGSCPVDKKFSSFYQQHT